MKKTRENCIHRHQVQMDLLLKMIILSLDSAKQESCIQTHHHYPNEGTENSSPLTSSSNSDDGSFEQVINKRPRLESQEYLLPEVQNHSDEHAPVLVTVKI